MRDIEQLLADRGNTKPRKPLRANFTSSVIEHIETQPRHMGLIARLKEKSAMKFHKPATALAVAAVTLALSGTVYAAFNWPTITSVFRSETRLPNGNRVVAVDAENCQYFGKSNPKSANRETMYYEIKKESKLTNDDIVDMVKGICEQNRVTEAVNIVIQPFLKSHEGKNIMSGGTSRVQSITDDKITLLLDRQLDPQMHYSTPVTYTLPGNVKAFDGTNPIKLSEVKPEDSVIIIVEDNHVMGSEMDFADPNHWDDPQFLTILAIIKVPPLSGSPDSFFRHLGTDFVRTEPCTTDPAGFCRAYEFD